MRRILIFNCRMARVLLPACVLLLTLAACKKYTDEPGKTDPRLSRRYCNDPEAVNFNRDFPGTADNSVCFYPADAFKGSYTFTDSIYSGGKLIRERPLILTFTAFDRTKMAASGFCEGSASSIALTANRQLRAVADTTIAKGQAGCRPQDTLSGAITQSLTDTTRIQVLLTVVSDTGTTQHRGTAYRQ